MQRSHTIFFALWGPASSIKGMNLVKKILASPSFVTVQNLFALSYHVGIILGSQTFGALGLYQINSRGMLWPYM